MRVTLLHNPSAGHGAHPRDELEAALGRAGHRVTYRSTKANGVERAIAEPADVLLAAGGDGTVAKAALALAGRSVPLAILPLGTANNIATALGVRGNPEEIVAALHLATPRRLDVATATAPWGTERFVESAGIGLFAELLRENAPVPDSIDEIAWGRRRLRRLLHRARPRPGWVELDGCREEGEYLLVAACNIGIIGPRLTLASRAEPGDRRLDVVTVQAENRGRLAEYLDLLADPTRNHLAFPFPARRACQIRIRWSPAGHLDDERWPRSGPSRPSAVVELAITEAPVQVLV